MENFNAYSKILFKYFGFKKLKDKQYEVIESIINGNDTLGIMYTGYGKSVCYILPALITGKMSIVVSPLISLMTDQQHKLVKNGISCYCLNSSGKKDPDFFNKLINNEYSIIFTTPEFMTKSKLLFKQVQDNICLFAIDEAHCISYYGHDFRPDFRKLNEVKESFEDIPLLALTATATEIIKKDICEQLHFKGANVIQTGFDRPNIYIEIIKKKKGILANLTRLITKRPIIIYCQKRQDTEDICEILNENKENAEYYHAGLSNVERDRVHKSFINNETDIISATNAFGMGIDHTVRTVIHYSPPADLTAYYQEIGRVGRDGKPSYAYLLYNNGDLNLHKYFLKNVEDMKYKKFKLKMIGKMDVYMNLHTCYREYLLSHFGEYGVACSNCSNCLKPRLENKVNVSKEAKMLMETMQYYDNKFGAGTIILILRGSKSKKLTKSQLNHENYGKGTNYSVKWWKNLSKTLIRNGYLKEENIQGSFKCKINVTDKGIESLCNDILLLEL